METNLVLFAAVVGMAVVRAPHIRRSTRLPVAASRESRLDRALVASVSLGMLLPIAWALGALRFADVAGSPLRVWVGAPCLALGLFVLHRSHVDLGTNWSNTLELRSGHTLVTRGVYARVRHPMYAALLLHGLGQLVLVPNWLVGPAFVLPFAVLVALRLPKEEQMMRDAFGCEYTAYAARSGLLLPASE